MGVGPCTRSRLPGRASAGVVSHQAPRLPGGCTSSAPVAQGLNGADQVAGYACNAHGDTHAFLWNNNGTPMVDLGPAELGSTSYGYALNASGLVTGEAVDSTGDSAFVPSG